MTFKRSSKSIDLENMKEFMYYDGGHSNNAVTHLIILLQKLHCEVYKVKIVLLLSQVLFLKLLNTLQQLHKNSRCGVIADETTLHKRQDDTEKNKLGHCTNLK